jgi:signal transduction histidine kinase
VEKAAKRRGTAPKRGARETLAGWPLAWRILLPLAALAAVFCFTLTYFVIHTVSRHMDRAVYHRLNELADALTAGDHALDPELLTRIRSVTAAEVVTFSPHGVVIASTLPDESARRLVSSVQSESRRRHAEIEGDHYDIVTRTMPVRGMDETVTLVIAASAKPTEKMKRDLAWVVLVAAVVGLVLLIIVGRFIVKSATRPLARLADAAREVGGGDIGRRVPGGGGQEIETLAAEFNHMLDELARSRVELVHAERLAAAGRVAANVAHEIRNPLSAIRMNVQLLTRRDELSRHAREELDEVLEEIERLDLVLANLLDLTVPPRLSTTFEDLNQVVRGTLRLTSGKLGHLGITTTIRLADELPRVWLDAHKVRQALLNVILNAEEAMPRGGSLRVATRRAGDQAEVIFEDTGTGVCNEIANQIFEPFFSTKRAGGGLGLHIVHNIMKLHGGGVRLEPVTPVGTRCVMRFPLSQESIRPQGVPAVSRSA